MIKPSAPIETLNPADILATAFRTEEGDPDFMEPRTVTADLTPFAGQTVRLRFAEVDNSGPINAGIDDVKVIGPNGAPTPPAPPAVPPPSNSFSFGGLKLNKKKGTATLTVSVPGAGSLAAVDAKKKGPKRVKKSTANAAAAGKVTLVLKPTGAGKKALQKKGKLQVTFTPSGGTAATQPFKGKLKLNP